MDSFGAQQQMYSSNEYKLATERRQLLREIKNIVTKAVSDIKAFKDGIDTLTRYDIVAEAADGDVWLDCKEDSTGTWVMFSDVQELVKKYL